MIIKIAEHPIPGQSLIRQLAKKREGSSAHTKQHPMKGELMKKEHFNPVPPEIQAEIDALAALQEPIRTDLIPEATGDWSGARRGLFYRSVKQQITLRLDADLIDWFRTHHPQGKAILFG